LGEGLNAANGASTSTKYVIHVARGTYYPTGTQSSSNRDSSFFIGRGGIQVLGGYPSGGGTRDAASNPTILSGNIGSTSSSTDNSYHIMVCAGISATADTTVVEGLRFTAGNANNTSGGKLYNGHFILRQHGGALHNRYVYTPLLVRDCSFYNNSTVSGGGAIYNDSSALHCSNSSFTANTAPSTSATGGAISWVNRNLAGAIRLCSFSNNSSGGSAGAISCHNLNTSMMIFGCTFTGNTSKLGGAIEMTRTSTATSIARNWIDSCSFSNNTATQNGGAIRDFNAGGYSTFITRSTFNNNSALLQGGAVHMNNADFLVCCNYMTWCSFTGNTAGGDGGAVWYTNTGSYAGNMENCYFTSNKSGGSGGGLYINASSGTSTVGAVED
jgi:predicted outer membrane repeat protein